MSYGCYVKNGSILFRNKKDGIKIISLLRELGVEACEFGPNELHIYKSGYIKYHEDDYKEIAALSENGSFLQFIGDEDAVWTLKFENGCIIDLSGKILWDHCEGSLLEISLSDGVTLVAERNRDPDYKEVFIYLRDDSTGCAYQDLAIVGERYTYDAENGDIEPVCGQYSVKVYADPETEDWTMEYNILRYEEERNDA